MIRSLNLDGMFVPTQHSEITFTMKKFSGGEMHIKLNNNISYLNVSKVVITNRFICELFYNGQGIVAVLDNSF